MTLWDFRPVQPGPAPARPSPALIRLVPGPALRAQATHGPAPARPRPGPAPGRSQAPESPQLGVPKMPRTTFYYVAHRSNRSKSTYCYPMFSQFLTRKFDTLGFPPGPARASPGQAQPSSPQACHPRFQIIQSPVLFFLFFVNYLIF